MRIVTTNQGSPEWFAARAGVITASRLSDLMAKTKTGPSTSRKNYLTQLAIERITQIREEGYRNAAMQRGTELEAMARAAYQAHTLTVVDEVGFALHAELDYVGASVDGLVGEEGLVEIKCPLAQGKHADALRFGTHAVEYRWQVIGQLWVSGRQWCDVVSYDDRFPEGLQLAITRIHRDDTVIAELACECAEANEEIDALVNELENLRSAA